MEAFADLKRRISEGMENDDSQTTYIIIAAVAIALLLLIILIIICRLRCRRRQSATTGDDKLKPLIVGNSGAAPIAVDITDIDFIDDREETKVISSTVQVNSLHNSPISAYAFTPLL